MKTKSIVKETSKFTIDTVNHSKALVFTLGKQDTTYHTKDEATVLSYLLKEQKEKKIHYIKVK